MRTELLKPFERLPYFTLEGIKQFLDDRGTVDQRARDILSNWIGSGTIISIKRGIYMHHRFLEIHRNDANFMPAVSAILVPQSYISLDYMLQSVSVLTEATYPVTAATIKNTRTFKNALGTFDYRHIQTPLYFGFSQEMYYGIIFFRASPAKALFDYLYLRPLPRSLRNHDLDLAEELRLNIDEFSKDQRNEFQSYVDSSRSKKMDFILKNLKATIWQP